GLGVELRRAAALRAAAEESDARDVVGTESNVPEGRAKHEQLVVVAVAPRHALRELHAPVVAALRARGRPREEARERVPEGPRVDGLGLRRVGARLEEALRLHRG